MRYLGIDYGKKKIGIALSDEGGRLAFPHSIISSSKNSDLEVIKIMKEAGAEEVVMGESTKETGESNPIQKNIEKFAEELKNKNVTVHFVKEFFTTSEARWSGKREKPTANKRSAAVAALRNSGHVDDSAAALILQRYLDRLK